MPNPTIHYSDQTNRLTPDGTAYATACKRSTLDVAWLGKGDEEAVTCKRCLAAMSKAPAAPEPAPAPASRPRRVTHYVADLESNPACGGSLVDGRGTTQLDRVDCATCLLEAAIEEPAAAPAPAARRHRVALVACSSSKLGTAAPARDLYRSDLFRKASRYAEREAEAWFVLSAKWHLVDPSTVLAPYDVELDSATVEEWAETTAGQLLTELEDLDLDLADVELLVLAGANYRTVLDYLPAELRAGAVVPLAGLGIGEQLSWLKSALEGGRPAPSPAATPVVAAPELEAEPLRRGPWKGRLGSPLCPGGAAAPDDPRNLERLVELRAELEEGIEACVIASRAAGKSWSVIAADLGVSKQAAAKRYGEACATAERAAIRAIREEFRAAR